MKRRTLIQCGLGLAFGTPLWGAWNKQQLEQAADVLANAVDKGQIAAATMHVMQARSSFTRSFGKASDANAMFLLGSISKPIAVMALLTLFDQGKFRLDDPLKKFLPKFRGAGRERVTIQHVLTHVSGLPDQLPENDALRKKHADLSEFVEHALQTPLHFAPGSRYQYSSMGILLAARVAEQINGADIHTLIEHTVFQPLGMQHSAQGLGRFKLEDMVMVQTERAAPESGGGDPTAKTWDWNSPYWRKLGAPWGGTHASASDIGHFLDELLHQRGKVLKPETARRMTENQNRQGLTPRGLGLNVGAAAGSRGCSDQTFGHTGSTGTICWADPGTATICVVLTSLPGRALEPHPRQVAAERVSLAVR